MDIPSLALRRRFGMPAVKCTYAQLVEVYAERIAGVLAETAQLDIGRFKPS